MRLLLVCCLVFAASVAHARNFKLDKGALAAWVPDQWSVNADNEAAISATAPSGAASVVYLTQPIRDLDAAYKNLATVVRAILPSAQFGKPQRVQVAGLSAIQIGAYADVATEAGTIKVEANVIVLITPNQRALYMMTLVQADGASAYDAAIRRILGGLQQASGGAAEPQKAGVAKENPCWELKGQPNGWSRREWNGVSFLLPRGWTSSETKDPDTDTALLQLADDGGASIVVFAYPAQSPAAAWQALGAQVQAYGLGDAAWGEVVGQRALCARGSASDGVVFHRGGTALVMLGRAGGDTSTMRGVLGSMRWR